MNSIVSRCHYYNELIGWLKIETTDEGINEIAFTEPPGDLLESPAHPLLNSLIIELDNYFQGKSGNFLTPIHFTQGTKFQQSVWNALLKIPAGETRSYCQVAAVVGNSKAARAVGSANGKNPIPIIVPCHRVVNSDGSLGGYSSGIHIKKALLDHEKIFFRTFPTETEAKVIIVSNEPRKIVYLLETLQSMAGFPLGPKREQCFQDLYFDLPDRSLSRKKWALRLRRRGDVEKIAMKGPASELSDGSLARSELEMVWNQNALKRILRFMQDQGIGIASTSERETMDATGSLKFLGLEVIQKRDTHRKTRAIFDSKKSASIAEMDIDQVSFTVGSQKFDHYEIEIESWATVKCPVIQKSLEFLTRKFGKSLVTWKLDKLTTVQLICDLFRTEQLSGHFSDNLLTLPAYELVWKESQRRSFGEAASS